MSEGLQAACEVGCHNESLTVTRNRVNNESATNCQSMSGRNGFGNHETAAQVSVDATDECAITCNLTNPNDGLLPTSGDTESRAEACEHECQLTQQFTNGLRDNVDPNAKQQNSQINGAENCNVDREASSEAVNIQQHAQSKAIEADTNFIISKKRSAAVSFTVDFHHAQTIAASRESPGSLQQCFARLHKQKQELLRGQNSPWALSPTERRSPERLNSLRAKFVAQARSYIGVPYSRKYWEPHEPEYSSPIYLDCCGLVRQVVRDLRDDFGFAIGPWNQAYMWDTLPTEFSSPNEMQLGDLVFVTGTYHKGKQQKHFVTHVEIWLADGERTLASRWWRGKVQEFDTYKFQPSSYHSHEYHFKSIEPWLAGECRSLCADHKWLTRQLKLSRRSVFALATNNETENDASAAASNQNCAGDADGDGDDEEQDESAEHADNI